MQAKTTRAFRTIGEAGDELGLQPHVLRFWESKFTDFSPMKRGGDRRYYRPEDIEFLRGLKTLLHGEKHTIKDVQKLIKKSGMARVAELGRSIEKASRERDVAEVSLVPDRISKPDLRVVKKAPRKAKPELTAPAPAPVPEPVAETPAPQAAPAPQDSRLREALERLERLKGRWDAFDDGRADPG